MNKTILIILTLFGISFDSIGQIEISASGGAISLSPPTTIPSLQATDVSKTFTIELKNCGSGGSIKLFSGTDEITSDQMVSSKYTFNGIITEKIEKGIIIESACSDITTKNFILKKPKVDFDFTFVNDKITLTPTDESVLKKLKFSDGLVISTSGCPVSPTFKLYDGKKTEVASIPNLIDNFFSLNTIDKEKIKAGLYIEATCRANTSKQFEIRKEKEEPKFKYAIEDGKIVLKTPDNVKNFDPKIAFNAEIIGCSTSPKIELFFGDDSSQSPNIDQETGIFKFIALSEDEIESNKTKDLKLKVSCGDATPIETILIKGEKPTPPTTNLGGVNLAENLGLYENLLQNPKKRYKRDKDEAYILMDSRANVVGALPVNLDSDDFISILIKGEATEINKLVFKVNGEYRTNDLEQTSQQKSDTKVQGGSGSKENNVIVKRVDVGWFTDELTINVYEKDNDGNIKSLLTQIPLKINKLYNVTYTVSMIKSYLNQPSFELSSLANSTNKTIIGISESKPFVTFNAIFYWNRFKSNSERKEDFLTRGRDILKEPIDNFFSRINPTVGVSIDRNIRENLFLGLTYQFARGGYIVGGRHFGMVKSLVDSNFKLGTDVFNGTNDDIKTKQDIKSDWYFGVSLDLRIFNRLFN